MLDLSVEYRSAHAGAPAYRDMISDIVGYLNTMLRRLLGKQFIRGELLHGVYVARFTSEDAARVAMGWCDFELCDFRILTFGSQATLTGHFSGERP